MDKRFGLRAGQLVAVYRRTEPVEKVVEETGAPAEPITQAAACIKGEPDARTRWVSLEDGNVHISRP